MYCAFMNRVVSQYILQSCWKNEQINSMFMVTFVKVGEKFI